MYQLKSAIKSAAGRSLAFAGATFMLAGVMASALPTVVHANALNPLTERTLTLTSSSPGFHYTDGSGNSPDNPNASGGNFAPPGSGPNGRQTGEKFSFKVSTDSSDTGTDEPIKAFTFQYCMTAAGDCSSPGDNIGNDNILVPAVDPEDPPVAHTPDRGGDTTSTSDLNVKYEDEDDPTCGVDFEILKASVPEDCEGWEIETANKENGLGKWTSKKNFITLSNADSTLQPTSGTLIEVIFNASATNYITNPGSGAFFVKINTFKTATNTDPTNPAHEGNIIDGGVTVANVMTDSIQIQTKVLETMSFSVGTENPDTVDPTPADHGPCDLITVNRDIKLGDPQAEFSLSSGKAYGAHSYWRLSSNSSGGATVYYSGATLNNTVGDNINAIGPTEKLSHPGMEQFGLAYDSTVDPLDDRDDPDDMVSKIAADALLDLDLQEGYEAPHISPLVPNTNYAHGSGGINSTDPGGIVAKFAYDANSLTEAVPFASYSADVIKCSTGKMRYVANISPNTPAGVYTTKLNYLAAPQY